MNMISFVVHRSKSVYSYGPFEVGFKIWDSTVIRLKVFHLILFTAVHNHPVDQQFH